MNNVPFNPAHLLQRAEAIEGFEVIKSRFPMIISSPVGDRVHTFGDAVYNSIEIVSMEYSDWDSDQGFGSSDMTYAVKSFIDEMIWYAGLNGKYETKFTPRLSVVEYSEMEYDNRMLRMEQGV